MNSQIDRWMGLLAFIGAITVAVLFGVIFVNFPTVGVMLLILAALSFVFTRGRDEFRSQ
jgi:hypothetical protein